MTDSISQVMAPATREGERMVSELGGSMWFNILLDRAVSEGKIEETKKIGPNVLV